MSTAITMINAICLEVFLFANKHQSTSAVVLTH